MGQGVRRWMVLMNPRMLPMPVACVTARATVSLDVCGCVVVHAVIGIHMLYTVVSLCRSDACAEHLMRCAVQPEPLPSRWRVNARQRSASGLLPDAPRAPSDFIFFPRARSSRVVQAID